MTRRNPSIEPRQLEIEHLHEFPYSPYDCYEFTEETEPGKAMIPGVEGKAPLLFSIKAKRQQP